MGSEDEVRLAVPAKPEFLGLARVTAAGLASRLGFTFDQVEDSQAGHRRNLLRDDREQRQRRHPGSPFLPQP